MRRGKGVDNQVSYKGVENADAGQATGHSRPTIGLRNCQGEAGPSEDRKIPYQNSEHVNENKGLA